MVAIAQTIGIVAGVGIASATGSVAAGYLATILWLVVLTVPYALGSRDLALPPGYRPRAVPARPVRPRRSGSRRAQHPDFAWAWITRFLVNLGNYIGTLYLLFYVTDGLGISAEDGRRPGARADRPVRRGDGRDDRRVRPLERPARPAQDLRDLVGGDLRGRGAGARDPADLAAALAAAVVLGCAYGIYTAVDFALITQVLPAAEERAKDLGVINIANALPPGARAGVRRRSS